MRGLLALSVRSGLRVGRRMVVLYAVIVGVMLAVVLVMVGVARVTVRPPTTSDIPLTAYAEASLTSLGCLADTKCADQGDAAKFLDGMVSPSGLTYTVSGKTTTVTPKGMNRAEWEMLSRTVTDGGSLDFRSITEEQIKVTQGQAYFTVGGVTGHLTFATSDGVQLLSITLGDQS